LAKMLMDECPCGFTFKTPHGEGDAAAVMQFHIQRVHKKEYPTGVTKLQAMEHIREAK